MVMVFTNSFTQERRVLYLSLSQRIRLRLGQSVAIGKRIYPGWSGYLEFYAFKCPACRGFHDDYPHGFDGSLFCPIVHAYVNKFAPVEVKSR